jgi:tight adherence protein C
VAFNLAANSGIVQPWSLGLTLNVAAQVAAQFGANARATKVEVAIDNQLQALSQTSAQGSSLAFIAKKRKEKIFLSLPDALDLMVVCVEAGLGLDQAMRKVAEELRESKPTIAYEFDICNKQLQWGRAREEVLVDLGDRSGVDDLKALASIIVQADRFGSSIGQALRVQSDSMRVRRRQIAEEKAAKTAVKLIFPLVLFIFPGIFVVLVGPAAITMVNEMLPAFKK